MDIRMELTRIVITETGDQQVIVLKEYDGERAFPIGIGISEALAIDRRLKGISIARPMTHDLLSSVMESLGGRLEKIVIDKLRDQVFYAKLHVRRNGDVHVIDSRPSDAIALGIANDTPIFVAEHVLEEATRL